MWRSSGDKRQVEAVQRVGQRLAMIAAQRGDQDALAIGEPGHVGIRNHVVGMLVMAHGADEVPDVVQVGRRFEQLAARGRQPVQRLERGEEQVAKCRPLCGHARSETP